MPATSEFSPLLHGEGQRFPGLNDSAEQRANGGAYEEHVRPVVAELLGTMLFVCVGVLCVQYVGSVSGVGSDASTAIAIAVGHGLAIAALVTALGDISGGHVNPAVTLGIALSGGIGPAKAALYVIAQLAGAVMGAGLSKAILPSDMFRTIGGGAHTLGEGVSPGQGVLCEILLTAVLVLAVILSAVDPKTKSPLAPLAIGSAVVVDILAGILITGASMNPARSFGPAVIISSETSEYWKYHYVYWVGPLVGALFASVCYRLLFASGERRLVFKS